MNSDEVSNLYHGEDPVEVQEHKSENESEDNFKFMCDDENQKLSEEDSEISYPKNEEEMIQSFRSKQNNLKFSAVSRNLIY